MPHIFAILSLINGFRELTWRSSDYTDARFINDSFNWRVLLLFLLQELLSLQINAGLTAQTRIKDIATQYEQHPWWRSLSLCHRRATCFCIWTWQKEPNVVRRLRLQCPTSVISYQLQPFPLTHSRHFTFHFITGRKKKLLKNKSELTHHPLVKLFNSAEPWDGGKMRQGAGAHFPKSLRLFMPQIGRNRTPPTLISLWEPRCCLRWGLRRTEGGRAARVTVFDLR